MKKKTVCILFYEELLLIAEKCNITILTENFNNLNIGIDKSYCRGICR